MIFLELEALRSEYVPEHDTTPILSAMGGGLTPQQLDGFIAAVNRGETSIEALAGYVRLTGLTTQVDLIRDGLSLPLRAAFDAAMTPETARTQQWLRALRKTAPSN